MTEPPRGLADRPAIRDVALGLLANGERHDLLSAVLSRVRLRGERLTDYGPPPTFSIDFVGMGTLHIIEQGELCLALDRNEQFVRLSRGDVALVPKGDHHLLSNAPHAAAQSPTSQPASEPTRWLCGTFTIGDPQASHLLTSLPPVITLRGARDQSLEGLEVARKMLLLETHSPSQGSVVMIERLLDLLFIQVLRFWAAGDDAPPNWLTGALDPQIGKALAAIHADPSQYWTVESLASVCDLSRSSFAERFATRVGRPPASYLAEVRLDAAANFLRDTTAPISQVAAEVGYTSEAAFSRAFRKSYGTPPARWRRNARPR